MGILVFGSYRMWWWSEGSREGLPCRETIVSIGARRVKNVCTLWHFYCYWLVKFCIVVEMAITEVFLEQAFGTFIISRPTLSCNHWLEFLTQNSIMMSVVMTSLKYEPAMHCSRERRSVIFFLLRAYREQIWRRQVIYYLTIHAIES